MKNQTTDKARWGTFSNSLLPIFIALIFFAFTFSYYPFREKLQFDTDEGLNLMRSMLVVLKYPLYSEISSDQPPLFTQVLALVFRIVGFEVNPARILVLLFSTMLVWAGAQFLQLTSGKLAALLFLPLIIIVPRYLGLSVSVMIGVPCIALAMVSMLFITLWHLKKNNVYLVISGFALALSALIKLFTGFLVPIFLIGITISAFLEERENGLSWKVFRPALTWTLCFAGLGTLLGLILVGPQNVWSIIFPPLTAPTKDIFQNESFAINTHLQAAVPLLFLGFGGILISSLKRNWLILYPLTWAILAYSLFSFYSPVFYHHQLLITIPAAMLAAAGLGEGIYALASIRRFPDVINIRTLLGVTILIGFAFVSIHYTPVLDKELMNKPRISNFTLKATLGKLKILRAMNEYADQTNWVVTDTPMYAFRIHRPVPPNLATFSQKRLSTGSLTEEDILLAMREYHPEQVLIARFEIPALEDYLKENYTLVASEEFLRLFIRNDLKPLTE
ncbi:MAG: glycosyltransferase family 39 protein [Anaerolineales bacterium]|nr:glycosyltransferase family 39 protein [Anaerolineales bacterium]